MPLSKLTKQTLHIYVSKESPCLFILWVLICFTLLYPIYSPLRPSQTRVYHLKAVYSTYDLPRCDLCSPRKEHSISCVSHHEALQDVIAALLGHLVTNGYGQALVASRGQRRSGRETIHYTGPFWLSWFSSVSYSK